MPHLAPWQWLLGVFSAFMIGVAKTGAPGVGSLISPVMVITIGDARLAAAWMQPMLSTGDFIALAYWWRHTEARRLFSLVPWVVVGILAGWAALSQRELLLRRMVAGVILTMLAVQLWRKWRAGEPSPGGAAFYGIAAGFAATIANAAGPVMNLYLLSKKLPKEKFVATGAAFFCVVNLLKVPIYAGYHLYSAGSLLFDLGMAPMVLVGALAGRWIIQNMRQSVFEILIIVLTAISSVLLLA